MHDMRVIQAGNPSGLRRETAPCRYAYQLSMQHFDGRLRLQVDMLTQVDITKATLPNQAHYAIVPRLLFDAVIHLYFSLLY